MLKLSNKGLYGIKALYELAQNYGGAPLKIREISKRHGLPFSFLEQVLHSLKLSGLVKSRRGVNGGYFLTRPPSEITIGDAVRALEGPIALCDCLQHTDSDVYSKRAMNCVTSDVYKRLGKKVENAFDSITLFDLAEEDYEKNTTGSCKTIINNTD